MKIAVMGDVVGSAGRKAIKRTLSSFKSEHNITFTVANIENVAGGFGMTEKSIKELEMAGIDFFTSGNHIWDKREGIPLLEDRDNIIRPANYPEASPGNGFSVVKVGDVSVAVINLQGRVFMPAIDCPFRTADRCVGVIGTQADIILVDMHAEATSEKVAMGWYLDGRVSLVAGTHTHVPTRDARILPKGTGYVTDVGMAGAYDSVLGVEKDAVLQRFLSMRPHRFNVARDDIRCDILIAEIDESNGKTIDLNHVQLKVEG